MDRVDSNCRELRIEANCLILCHKPKTFESFDYYSASRFINTDGTNDGSYWISYNLVFNNNKHVQEYN